MLSHEVPIAHCLVPLGLSFYFLARKWESLYTEICSKEGRVAPAADGWSFISRNPGRSNKEAVSNKEVAVEQPRSYKSSIIKDLFFSKAFLVSFLATTVSLATFFNPLVTIAGALGAGYVAKSATRMQNVVDTSMILRFLTLALLTATCLYTTVTVTGSFLGTNAEARAAIDLTRLSRAYNQLVDPGEREAWEKANVKVSSIDFVVTYFLTSFLSVTTLVAAISRVFNLYNNSKEASKPKTLWTSLCRFPRDTMLQLYVAAFVLIGAYWYKQHRVVVYAVFDDPFKILKLQSFEKEPTNIVEAYDKAMAEYRQYYSISKN